jgi:hypothetical protein
MGTKKEDWDIEKALNAKFPTYYSEFDSINPIIYALSIGLSRDTKNIEDLKYTYE